MTYALGRSLDVDEALMLARRATFDPGQFTERVLHREGEQETLERWQARAVLVALAADQTDERYAWANGRGPDIREDERAELQRLDLELHSEAKRERDTWTCPNCNACVPLVWSQCQLCGAQAPSQEAQR